MNPFRYISISMLLLAALYIGCGPTQMGAAHPLSKNERYLLPIARSGPEMLLGFGLKCETENTCIDISTRQQLGGKPSSDGSTGKLAAEKKEEASSKIRAALKEATINCGGDVAVKFSDLSEQVVDVDIVEGSILRDIVVGKDGAECCVKDPNWDKCDGLVVVRAYKTKTTISAKTATAFNPSADVKCNVTSTVDIGADVSVAINETNRVTISSTGWNMVDVDFIEAACPGH